MAWAWRAHGRRTGDLNRQWEEEQGRRGGKESMSLSPDRLPQPSSLSPSLSLCTMPSGTPPTLTAAFSNIPPHYLPSFLLFHDAFRCGALAFLLSQPSLPLQAPHQHFSSLLPQTGTFSSLINSLPALLFVFMYYHDRTEPTGRRRLACAGKAYKHKHDNKHLTLSTCSDFS